ncbi:SulP family inorganic anion transporter [Streptantibioticus rubrisoli]|nr:SulP family inorganic anion transporter [Streptantibioticus rubrisoli]
MTQRIGLLCPSWRDLVAVRGSIPREIKAGLISALSMAPSVLGLGVASGLGAYSGVASAVVGGTLAVLLGGVPTQITAPTGVLVVVLGPVVRAYGPLGTLNVGLLAGLLLVAASLIGAGRGMRYVPVTLIQGFFVGGALLITLRQINLILGSPGRRTGPVVLATVKAVTAFATHPHWYAVAVASTTLTVRMLESRLRLPGFLTAAAVATATALTQRLHLPLHHIGYGIRGLPRPSSAFLQTAWIVPLLPSAALLALVVAMESLRVVVSAQPSAAENQHSEDKELFGQGVANLTVPFFAGVAAAGSATRTAVNTRAGATSRLSALASCATLALLSFTAAPLIAQIPRVALSGVVIATMLRSINVSTLRSIARADRGQAVIVAVTAASPLVFNFAIAITAGSVLAITLGLRSVARTARVKRLSPYRESEFLDSLPVRRIPGTMPAEGRIARYSFHGPLLFATADRLLRPVSQTAAPAVILDLTGLTTIDVTGLAALRSTVHALAVRGTHVALRGVRAEHIAALRSAGLLDSTRATAQQTEDAAHTAAHAVAK